MFRLFDPAPYDLYCVGGTLSLTQSIIDPAISRDYTSESDVHWRRFYFHLTCVHSALELFGRCALQIYLLTYLLWWLRLYHCDFEISSTLFNLAIVFSSFSTLPLLVLNKFILHNQNKTRSLWRVDLFQRPSSEEDGTYNSSEYWHNDQPSCQESGRTELAELIGALVRIYGLLTFLADVNGFLDPHGGTVWLSVNHCWFCPVDHMVLFSYHYSFIL